MVLTQLVDQTSPLLTAGEALVATLRSPLVPLDFLVK